LAIILKERARESLEPLMLFKRRFKRVSEGGAPEVVRETEGFSFAYMKELFVASMVQRDVER